MTKTPVEMAGVDWLPRCRQFNNSGSKGECDEEVSLSTLLAGTSLAAFMAVPAMTQDGGFASVKTVPREGKGQSYSNNRGGSGYSCATDYPRRFAGPGTEARVAADDAAPAPRFRAEEAHPIRGR